MDFALPPRYADLAREATEFARRHTSDLAVLEDSWLRGSSAAFARELGAKGWIGLSWPTEYGGGGRDPLERFVITEALITEGAPIASCWFADRQIGPTLLSVGSDEQRNSFLPKILSGDSMWCIGMSEPDAGSDVASLRTTARRSGDEWIVSGAKVWTSGAHESDWCYLIARTDPDAPAHKGLSEFIVDMSSPGIDVRPIRDATNDSHFCEVRFDQVAVPANRLVGTENAAFRQIMRQMEFERGGIDRLVSNRRLFTETVEALTEDQRRDPRVRNDVAALSGGYQIGRNLVLREVLGQAPKGFSAVTKTWCTEYEQRVAGFCFDAAGPSSMLSGRAARNICYAPGYTIMGGTTEILRNIIGERLLELPRGPR